MKKYVKASEEDVTQEQIHDAALEMVWEILEDGKERWGEYSAYGGVGSIFETLGLDKRQQSGSIDDVLYDNGYKEILYSIDEEIEKIVDKLQNMVDSDSI